MDQLIKMIMFVHDGFEEAEALTAVDLLRRAGVKTDVCSMTGNTVIKGSHGISVFADLEFSDICDAGGKMESGAVEEGALADFSAITDSYDGMILPGGQPNSFSLRDDERITELVKAFDRKGKLVAAICAAPCVLDRAGVLDGKRCTSYPGMISPDNKIYLEEAAVTDGNIITSRGAGTSVEFALAIVGKLCGAAKADQIATRIMFRS
ncbi:MAG: DJ-1/PfpI family protein [Clostridia bacterium]|nr:DJ-1/PfpI family protein [Clostridia bacterium]